MFVRFRKTGSRLQASLIETHRVDRRVRHEHIASLIPPSLNDRIDFWRRLHERVGQLSNRLDGATQGKVLGEIHARVPMPTIEEIRALQLQNSEADEELWTGLRDMRQATADEHKQLLASIQQAIASAEADAKEAADKANSARERVRRLRAGEDIPGGLSGQLKQDNFERILRDAGWTTRDIEHMRVVQRLSEIGGFGEYLNEVHKRHRLAEYAAARAILRRLA